MGVLDFASFHCAIFHFSDDKNKNEEGGKQRLIEHRDGGANREERQDERGPDAALGGPRHSVVVRLGRSRFAFPLHPPRLVIMTEKPCHHLLRHGCL